MRVLTMCGTKRTLLQAHLIAEDYLPFSNLSIPMEDYKLFDGQGTPIEVRQTWVNNSVQARKTEDPIYTYIKFHGESQWYWLPKGALPNSHANIWR